VPDLALYLATGTGGLPDRGQDARREDWRAKATAAQVHAVQVDATVVQNRMAGAEWLCAGRRP